MFKRSHSILLFALLFISHQFVIVHADEDADKNAEDPDVQVEDEGNAESKMNDKDEGNAESKMNDKDEKSSDENAEGADKKAEEEELPKTIMIGDKEVEIERADRTVTAEVTFEISFGKEVMGNVTFGLFGKQCPKTVRNFVTLANPLRGKGEGYKGSKIHRIVRGFAIQGGDYTNNDGSGGWSIYGRYFRDENFAINHFPFCLAMANAGPNTNGSQFFVPLIRTKWLDGKHVVFGQVEGGHKLIKRINEVRVNRFSRPLRQVWISDTWTSVKKIERTKTEL